MKNNDKEPSLNDIDDYNGKVTKEKNLTINIIIISLITITVISYILVI